MRETVMAGHSAEVRAKMREKWQPAYTAMYMRDKSTLSNVIFLCLDDCTEMTHSTDARIPFLSHYLTEYINLLSPSTKLNNFPPDENGDDDVNNFLVEICRQGSPTYPRETDTA